jgi:hypothetical protein
MGANETLSQGTHGAGGDIVDYSYYDTATLATATTTHRLFTAGLSSGKTKAQTNFPIGGAMPQAQRLTINRLKIMYTAVEARTNAEVQYVYDFLRRTVLSFIIPGKDVQFEALLQEVIGTATLITQTESCALSEIPVIIQPRYHGIFPLNKPIVLAALTPFEVDLTLTAASNAGLDGDLVTVSLNGTLERGN